jgi:hypothetical protein
MVHKVKRAEKEIRVLRACCDAEMGKERQFTQTQALK